MTDKKIKKHTIGAGIVHKEGGFEGMAFSGDLPFEDGERVFMMKESTYNLLVTHANQMRMRTEKMDSGLMKKLPLGLKFGSEDKAETFVFEGTLYINSHGIWVRYIPFDLGIRELEEGHYDHQGR